jgi:hypothetical protein
MLKTAESRLERKLTLLVLVIGPMLALAGCAYGELKQVLRAQVASETSCGDVTVESSSVYAPGYKPGQYRVKGCGTDRVYSCPKDAGLVEYGSKVCSYVDSKAVKAPEPTPMAAPSGDMGGDTGGSLDAPPLEPEPLDDSNSEP